MSGFLTDWRDGIEAHLSRSPAAKDGRPEDGVEPAQVIALALIDLCGAVRENTAAILSSDDSPSPPGRGKK